MPDFDTESVTRWRQDDRDGGDPHRHEIDDQRNDEHTASRLFPGVEIREE